MGSGAAQAAGGQGPPAYPDRAAGQSPASRPRSRLTPRIRRLPCGRSRGAACTHHGEAPPRDPAPSLPHPTCLWPRVRAVGRSEPLAVLSSLSGAVTGSARLTGRLPRAARPERCARLCPSAAYRHARVFVGVAVPCAGLVPIFPGEGRTFREAASSESLLHRALRGLASSSTSLGSSRSVPRRVPSARRSLPTSSRPSRCSAGRPGGKSGPKHVGSPTASRGVRPPPAPPPHLGGEVILEPPRSPAFLTKSAGVAVLQPGLQQAEAPPAGALVKVELGSWWALEAEEA